VLRLALGPETSDPGLVALGIAVERLADAVCVCLDFIGDEPASGGVRLRTMAIHFGGVEARRQRSLDSVAARAIRSRQKMLARGLAASARPR
jgi:hypothetical protein